MSVCSVSVYGVVCVTESRRPDSGDGRYVPEAARGGRIRPIRVCRVQLLAAAASSLAPHVVAGRTEYLRAMSASLGRETAGAADVRDRRRIQSPPIAHDLW